VPDDYLRDVGLVRLDAVHEDREADRDRLACVKPSGRERVEFRDRALFPECRASEGAEREERSDRQDVDASHAFLRTVAAWPLRHSVSIQRSALKVPATSVRNDERSGAEETRGAQTVSSSRKAMNTRTDAPMKDAR